MPNKLLHKNKKTFILSPSFNKSHKKRKSFKKIITQKNYLCELSKKKNFPKYDLIHQLYHLS